MDTDEIDEVIERKTYIKRPKIANLTQIIFVISMKKPKPDLLMLDKQLAFAELNNINPINPITINTFFSFTLSFLFNLLIITFNKFIDFCHYAIVF